MLADLKRQGEARARRPLRVEWRDLPAEVLGAAWVDLSGTATIAIARRLQSDPGETERTFFHELGHIRFGDVTEPRPDPTNQELLERARRAGYATNKREKTANNYMALHAGEGRPMPARQQTAPARPAAPAAQTGAQAKREGQTMATWQDLAAQAAVDVRGVQVTVRRALDALPLSEERERLRLAEVRGGSLIKLSTIESEGAASARALALAESEARRGAALYVTACTGARVAVPETVRRLAAGEGRPAPMPTRGKATAAPVRTPTAAPVRQTQGDGETWEYAALPRRRPPAGHR